MYRYQKLLELREKITELNNNFIIIHSALDNIEERIKLNNISMFIKYLLRQVEECFSLLYEDIIEIIKDETYNLFLYRFSEIKSLLKLLDEVLEKSSNIIDNDLLDDICNILIRFSDECVLAINNSKCKIYPNENV